MAVDVGDGEARGLPISHIVDYYEGRVMGYIAGAVDWRSDVARALIRYYTGRIRN